MEEKTRGPP